MISVFMVSIGCYGIGYEYGANVGWCLWMICAGICINKD